jgi:Ran GTPase-activating protein (RanGAP) involved in mRNA processing and transport
MVSTVRLPNNNIPDEGVEALVRCIAGCPTITELNISGNRMGPKGCKALMDVLGTR